MRPLHAFANQVAWWFPASSLGGGGSIESTEGQPLKALPRHGGASGLAWKKATSRLATRRRRRSGKLSKRQASHPWQARFLLRKVCWSRCGSFKISKDARQYLDGCVISARDTLLLQGTLKHPRRMALASQPEGRLISRQKHKVLYRLQFLSGLLALRR